MKIVFFGTFLSEHQTALCDAFYAADNSFRFVGFGKINEQRKQIGFADYSARPYYIEAKSTELDDIFKSLDVAIVGGAPSYLIHTLISMNKRVFLFSERFYKKGTWRRFIPSTLKSVKQRFENDNNFSALCASSFLPYDLKLSGYNGKCYQWGYFLKKNDVNIDEILDNKIEDSILWVSRFIKLKHPEIMIKLATDLKKENVNVKITMVGDGPLLDITKNDAKMHNLDIDFTGALSHNEVLDLMKKYKIFIFTSDKREGWGAVVNEALSCGCITIANKQIGSVKFLLENENTGLTYKNYPDLFDKTKYALNLNRDFAKAGYEFVTGEYSPEKAVSNFYKLLNSQEIEKGVCSDVTYS